MVAMNGIAMSSQCQKTPGWFRISRCANSLPETWITVSNTSPLCCPRHQRTALRTRRSERCCSSSEVRYGRPRCLARCLGATRGCCNEKVRLDFRPNIAMYSSFAPAEHRVLSLVCHTHPALFTIEARSRRRCYIEAIPPQSRQSCRVLCRLVLVVL